MSQGAFRHMTFVPLRLMVNPEAVTTLAKQEGRPEEVPLCAPGGHNHQQTAIQ